MARLKWIKKTFIIGTIITIFFILITNVLSIFKIISIQTDAMESNIADITNGMTVNLEAFLDDKKNTLKNITKTDMVLNVINQYNDKGYADSDKIIRVAELMNGIKNTDSSVEECNIINKDSNIIVSTNREKYGRKVTLNDKEIAFSKDNQNSILLTIPISINDSYSGSLVCIINLKYSNEVLKNLKFLKYGSVFLIDQDGTIIIDIDEDSPEKHSISEINKLSDFKESHEGIINYKVKGIEKLAFYSKVDSSNIIVVGIVDKAEILRPLLVSNIKNAICILVIAISISIILCLITSVLILRKFDDALMVIRKIKHGDYKARFTYRKDNEWGYATRVLNSLMDKMESDREQMRINEKKYKIALSQCNDMIFEFNYSNNTIKFSHDWEKTEDKSKQLKIYSAEKFLYDDHNIYKDDIQKIKEFAQNIQTNKSKYTIKARIRKNGGKYIWAKISGTPIEDDRGKVVKIIGSVINIDEDHKRHEKIRIEAELDSLTKLYNKGHAVKLIKEHMNISKESNALFIIDIDDFKSINDTLGHLYGDQALIKVAAILNNVFKDNCIIGRIGGDEFIVFLKNACSTEYVTDFTKKLIDSFSRSFTGCNEDYKISASIGVALFRGNTYMKYEEIFKKADEALYASKNDGKDTYNLVEIQN